MKSEIQAALAVNLSYVLHEPSTSTEVQHVIEQVTAENRRCITATRQFAKLHDHDLATRVVILDERGAPASGGYVNLHVVSVRVGAWALLPELLHATGIIAPGTRANCSYLDSPDTNSLQSFPLFRGLAQLHALSQTQASADVCLFASAVFRPGYKSILLRFNELESDFTNAAGQDPSWRSAATVAEMAIREFVYQWSCPRALWERPAEDALPEFESRGNGTAACGR